MKSSDAPDFDKQTNRVIIANANELKARPDVFTRFMRGYRGSIAWIYSSPEGLKAYAAFAKLSEPTARRALQEFLSAAGDETLCVQLDAIIGLFDLKAHGVGRIDIFKGRQPYGKLEPVQF